MNRVIFHLVLFSQINAGRRTGFIILIQPVYLFTCLPVCHLKRSRRSKTFEEVTEYGHTSVWWFFWVKDT